MDMYMQNRFPNINDEYNKNIVARFGNVNPASQSPRINDNDEDFWNDSDSELDEKTFFTIGAHKIDELTNSSPNRL